MPTPRAIAGPWRSDIREEPRPLSADPMLVKMSPMPPELPPEEEPVPRSAKGLEVGIGKLGIGKVGKPSCRFSASSRLYRSWMVAVVLEGVNRPVDDRVAVSYSSGVLKILSAWRCAATEKAARRNNTTAAASRAFSDLPGRLLS